LRASERAISEANRSLSVLAAENRALQAESSRLAGERRATESSLKSARPPSSAC